MFKEIMNFIEDTKNDIKKSNRQLDLEFAKNEKEFEKQKNKILKKQNEIKNFNR